MSRKILVVDDNLDSTVILRSILETLGLRRTGGAQRSGGAGADRA